MTQDIDPKLPDYDANASMEGLILCLATERDELKAINAELVGALHGMMEIAEIAMPTTFFQSDSRVCAARAALAKAKGESQ